MFWVASAIRLARPIPPTPIPAMLSLSLGGVKPRPRTCRGTIVKALAVVAAPETAAAAAVVRNLRRDNSVFAHIGPHCRQPLYRDCAPNKRKFSFGLRGGAKSN